VRRWRLWWRALRDRREFERELAEELDSHQHLRADDLVARGVPRAEAMRRARLELGMRELHADGCRRARGLAAVDAVARDLRYAVRGMRRNPGRGMTAIGVLAVALAANALLFTFYEAYALRSPIADSSRWVSLEAWNLRDERIAQWTPDEADAMLRTPPAGLAQVYSLREVRLTVSAAATRLTGGEAVSDNYFEAIGINAARGRAFARGHVGTRELVLSDVGWRRLLPGVRDPLGQRIDVAGQPFTVIGVMPPGFTGTTPMLAMFWLREHDLRALPGREAEPRDLPLLELGAMREPATSPAQASAALLGWMGGWKAQRPEALRAVRAEAVPRRGYLPANDVDEFMDACIPVAIAFVLVLAVAAANLANLVLAGFAARSGELAVRVALGASRRRLVAQLFTESVLLACLAGVLGFGLAAVALQPLQAWLFALAGDFGLDLIDLRIAPAMLAWSLGLGLLATLVFGLVPALLATVPWRAAAPLARMATAGARLRGMLMVAQLAASVVLLVLAGLVASNARDIARTQVGFDPARTVAVHPRAATPALLRELQALPQVRQVALASRAPLMGTPHRADARIGAASTPVHVRGVDAAYFAVLGIDLLRGRGFAPADEAGAQVALVSRRTADTLWPGREPLGQVFELPPQDSLGRLRDGRFEVVGVVEDVVSAWFAAGIDGSAVYLPLGAGDPAVGSLVLQVGDTSPATLEALAMAGARVAPGQSIELMPMALAVRMQKLPFFAAAAVAGGLGWVALGISCLGLYGLVGYLVVQRRAELGVRMALGAAPGRVVRELLRVALNQVGLGLAIGLPLAIAAARVGASITERLGGFDGLAFVGVPMLLAGLALVAAWLPARHAARIAPAEALRAE
jgi:predicted permease